MSASTSSLSKERQRSVEAVAEFVSLAHALERGDLAKAADAQERLRQLGFAVRARRAERKGGDNAK